MMPEGRTWPVVSVVTPSLNQGEFLEETIRSVLLQGYPNLEYMVVDGRSEDGSVAIIEKYQGWLSWWVSEPDRGQVDAINKGLSRATGNVFNWINSDDVLVPGALAVVARGLRDEDHAFAAACRVFGEGYQERSLGNRRLHAVDLVRSRKGTRLQQQAFWVRPGLIEACGGLDATFHFFFDVEFAIRYVAMFHRIRYSNAVLASFRFHPGSKSVANLQEFHREYVRTLEKVRDTGALRSLRRHAALRLEELDRHRELARLLGDTARPRWRRAMTLIGMALRRPRPPLLRISAAALRRLVLGRQWIVGAGASQ
jgi:glycosyltransferase involved in cell wall biosynthesis